MGRGATATPLKQRNTTATDTEDSALVNQNRIGYALMPNPETRIASPDGTSTENRDRYWTLKASSKHKASACTTQSHHPRCLGVLRPLYDYCDADNELGQIVVNDAQVQRAQAQTALDALYGQQNQLFGSAAGPATGTSGQLPQGTNPWYDTVVPSNIGTALA